MVVFDAAFLLMILNGQMPPPQDCITGHVVTDFRKRSDFLLYELKKKREKILIPTPAFSEILVRANKARTDYINMLTKSRDFQIKPFCIMAATEVAIMTDKAIATGDKKSGSHETWNKIKYDRQIIAIARVYNASTIYTNDKGLIKFASDIGMNPISIGQLELPPEEAQRALNL